MVKSLKYVAHGFKWLVLLSLMLFLGLAIWLHQGERSLAFIKPWLTATINSPEAPYAITIGDVTVKWTDVTALGKLRIKNVTFSKRDGNLFAQFPEVYATIDPIGFLPDRHVLHRVLLRQPHLFAVRSTDGNIEFGFENSPARMPLAELAAFLAASEDTPESKSKSINLPFSSLFIDNATLTFTDEKTQTVITSDALDLQLRRKRGAYDAVLSLPFMVDAQPVMVSAGLRALPETHEHVLAVQFKEVPSRLVCLFDTCPEGIEADGSLDGNLAIGILDKDFSIHGFSAKFATKKARVTAPTYFAEPLKLGASNVTIEGDWSKRVIMLREAHLQLEDTAITASANIHQDDKGWYVDADASCTQLDIKKLYKYWPLTMAHDSRTWVTNKLKSGYAASGKIKLNLTPADFAAEYFSDKSVDAVADARDITFEYLPGFPKVEKMNGIAHFTGTTVKVEGGGGTLLDGTKIDHAILWCPRLMSSKNPMEATISLTAPASDAVNLLALKHFPFDDAFGLDAKTIKGTVDGDLRLKFNAFSENPNDDPNAIHLEAVDYDIITKLNGVAQKNVYGGYNINAMNGTLKADNKGLNFEGTVDVGEAGVNNVKLEQSQGKPLQVSVSGVEGKEPRILNDFTLSYNSSEIPIIRVSGKRLDASVSYGGSENSLLANFPAMDLNVDLGELVLSKDASFTAVKGTMLCSKIRCESAEFNARVGNEDLHAAIDKQAGRRTLNVVTNDAGSLLKALDITDRMTKGKFEIHGVYDDAKTPPALDARLIITDFNLKNSKILGRIFAIGSLTGLQNALTGSGIAFEKLAANLGSRAGIIDVDKGVANGASMGITFGGSVDTNTTKLNLKGVVAPAYALNSILGKIPIIGTIAGGEEGLIAFNYSVKGTYSDPDVSVNPLSGLTPGFLRGIFGGGSGESKSNKENEVKSKDNKPTGGAPKSNVHRPN